MKGFAAAANFGYKLRCQSFAPFFGVACLPLTASNGPPTFLVHAVPQICERRPRLPPATEPFLGTGATEPFFPFFSPLSPFGSWLTPWTPSGGLSYSMQIAATCWQALESWGCLCRMVHGCPQGGGKLGRDREVSSSGFTPAAQRRRPFIQAA